MVAEKPLLFHDDNEADESTTSVNGPEHSLKKDGQLPRVFKLGFKAVIICLAIWGTLDLGRLGYDSISKLVYPPLENPCDVCGDTPEEAIARGSKYDILLSTWNPTFCMDEELLTEFEREGPNGTWTYWVDPAGTKEIARSELPMLYGVDAWTTFDWHITHCIYTWRKEWRASTMKKFTLDGNSGEKHIKHCGRMIRGGLKHPTAITTHLDSKFLDGKQRAGS
jgi:hypothetical protein